MYIHVYVCRYVGKYVGRFVGRYVGTTSSCLIEDIYVVWHMYEYVFALSVELPWKDAKLSITDVQSKGDKNWFPLRKVHGVIHVFMHGTSKRVHKS